MNASLIQVGVILLITTFRDVAGAVWYKSQFTGTIPINDTKWSVKVRSVTECCYQCTFSSKCRSFQYETESGNCTLLFSLGQTGPFVNSSEIVHYRNYLVCPERYYLLLISNACVVLYPDYMPWNDSLNACQSEGADFPILDTDTLFNEFLDYIDNQVISPDRVAVNGRLINNIGYWGNGDAIDVSKFCAFQPDEIGIPDICLFVAHSSESWCGSPVNRLDEAKYDPCYNVNCGVGTCSGGTCSCPDGYSGSNCENSCPTGYDWLSSSNTCVKFYDGDYRSWANLKSACQAGGADLPLLNTDTLFNDFRIYMDQKSSDRVAVDGTLSGNQGIWSNGEVLSSNIFCYGNPDLTFQSNVCLYFEDTAAGYCGTSNNRIDDSYCHTSALRICMKKL